MSHHNYAGYGLALATRVPTPEQPLLIGVTGRFRSGKSTVAQMVAEGYASARFGWADRLKVEVYDYLSTGKFFLPMISTGDLFRKATIGLDGPFPPRPVLPTDDEKIAWVNDNKAILGATLQWWGTEYRRTQDLDYWIKQGVARYEALRAENRYAVITNDDLKFPNEADALHRLGFKLIRVLVGDHEQEQRAVATDGAVSRSTTHASETGLDGYALDYTVPNNGTLVDLRRCVEQTLTEMLR